MLEIMAKPLNKQLNAVTCSQITFTESDSLIQSAWGHLNVNNLRVAGSAARTNNFEIIQLLQNSNMNRFNENWTALSFVENLH